VVRQDAPPSAGDGRPRGSARQRPAAGAPRAARPRPPAPPRRPAPPPPGEQPDERLLLGVRRTALLVLVLGVFAFLIVGANRPANPKLVPQVGQVPAAGLTAFGTASLSVKAGAGLTAPARPGCVLVASTTSQRQRGLMGLTSLHGFVGMVFTPGRPSNDSFYMRGTVIPLSIAWFDANGSFIASFNMAPCPSSAQVCPTYNAGRPYTLALEVPEGRLAPLGVGPGSSIHLAGLCAGSY
jgi:uncharacterized protein